MSMCMTLKMTSLVVALFIPSATLPPWLGHGKTRVTVVSMSFLPKGYPSHDREFNLIGKDKILPRMIIKEGVEYQLMIKFRVEGRIVSGLKFRSVYTRKGVTVDKQLYMVGSYGPNSPRGRSFHEYTTPVQEAPKGMLTRGNYKVKCSFVDDDKRVWKTWEWDFNLQPDWASLSKSYEEPTQPRVTVVSMSFLPKGYPSHDRVFNLAKEGQEFPQIIKEGVKFHLMIKFRVEGRIVSGLRFQTATSRKGVTVYKDSYMYNVGSYGPNSPLGRSYYEYTTPMEEMPKGMIYRGNYKVKCSFVNADKKVYKTWEWDFKLQPDWRVKAEVPEAEVPEAEVQEAEVPIPEAERPSTK